MEWMNKSVRIPKIVGFKRTVPFVGKTNNTMSTIRYTKYIFEKTKKSISFLLGN